MAWRKRMGIEPTARCSRANGFEDREGHQTPVASNRPERWQRQDSRIELP